MPLGPPRTTRLIETLIDPLLRQIAFDATGDRNVFAQLVNEQEPNNNYGEPNDLGAISPDEVIHLSGDVDSASDPYDCFIYEASQSGAIDITMFRGDEVLYENTHTVEQGEILWFTAFAGDESFHYDTYIDHVFIA